MSNFEGPDRPMVCMTHLRFIPCRADDGCVMSQEPGDVDRVRRYQQGSATAWHRLVGFEPGPCDCTGAECADPWIEFTEADGCVIHGLDGQPEKRQDIGQAYVDLVNAAADDLRATAWRRSAGLLPPEVER